MKVLGEGHSQEEQEARNVAFADADTLVRAKVARSDIQLLCKFVEGLGHLGVVTTTDRMNGEVIIQTTKYCWPDLQQAIEQMPINVEFL